MPNNNIHVSSPFSPCLKCHLATLISVGKVLALFYPACIQMRHGGRRRHRTCGMCAGALFRVWQIMCGVVRVRRGILDRTPFVMLVLVGREVSDGWHETWTCQWVILWLGTYFPQFFCLLLSNNSGQWNPTWTNTCWPGMVGWAPSRCVVVYACWHSMVAGQVTSQPSGSEINTQFSIPNIIPHPWTSMPNLTFRT